MKKVLVQFEFPTTTTTQYDNVWKDLRAAGHNEPVGLIHHVGAKSNDSLVVVDVWESEEAFTKFGSVLIPLLQKHGLADVKPRITPVHYEYAGKALAGVTA